MTEENRQGYASSLAGNLLLVAMIGVACAAYFLAYLPNRARSEKLDSELAVITGRIDRLQERISNLNLAVEELESMEPEATKNAIMEVLHKGSKGSYIIPDARVDSATDSN
ncbi:MAG: hypothetical protein JXR97_17080 [Planctomycetes bacterium]|nr:hypothetical protein [Planctomycetota bacterium]